MSPADAQALEEFLSVCDQFKLGDLPTEQPHPETLRLSEAAQNDLPQAVAMLKRVDDLALPVLLRELEGIQALAAQMRACWNKGGRVFLGGCGATGRLSLALETLARESGEAFYKTHPVIGFMAGGDAALIKSIESFEDHPDYGARELDELGFRLGDLMVGITEGGETPFVIGATEHAIRQGGMTPWFCYCNPDTVLCRVAERSKRILQNPAVRKLNLSVGPMGISGSTRMQASTVQMAAVGLAIFYADKPELMQAAAEQIMALTNRIDEQALAALIDSEAQVYQKNGYTLYETHAYGITVLTDTTERAPTFSLAGFENTLNPEDPKSRTYLRVLGTPTSAQAWEKLLFRTPRCLDWDFCKGRTQLSTLYGFDISAQSPRATQPHARAYRLDQREGKLVFETEGLAHTSAVGDLPLLARHLLGKLILNTHSTLVMGRIGRYEGNLMTWVRPSNLKLIDRTIRYVRTLAERRGLSAPDYTQTARRIFEIRSSLRADEPTVLRVLETFKP